MASLPVIPAATLERDELKEATATEESLAVKNKAQVIENLSSYLDGLWEIAVKNKDIHEGTNLGSLRARNGEYDPSHLQAMRAVFGADYEPVFMGVTDTKCRAAESWIRETVMSVGSDNFDLVPTPIPELPAYIQNEVKQTAINTILERFQQQAMQTGIPVDGEAVMLLLSEAMPFINKQVLKMTRTKATEAAAQMKEKIDDMFVEGGWYDAVDKGIYDLVTYGTMIIKGPILKKSPVRVVDFSPESGTWEDRIEQRIIPTWERRSPFDIYPSPDCTSADDGWIFDRIVLSRKSLSDLIDVPGYDSEAIREVLREHRESGLRDWTSEDVERKEAEGNESSTVIDSEAIDCLEFHGTIPGSLLLEWGLTEKEIPDADLEYDAIVWMIDEWCIKAMINPDPLGRKYFYKACFADNPDSFWGKGVPRLIRHVQTLANATARQVAQNVAIASGPMAEMNEDRLAPGETPTFYPWKVIRTTNAGMAEGEAVRFYQPNMVTARLLEVYNWCMLLADEDSGVPRYIQGETKGIGGAGETASGLSMLMSHAAKGVRSVIRNIDIGVIEPSVEQAFHYNMRYERDMDIIGDLRPVAKGSISLANKEQQAIRRTEFLQITNNPIDNQIVGPKGRAELIRENLKALDIDPDKIMGDMDGQEAMALQGAQPESLGPTGQGANGQTPGAPPPAPDGVDAAGNPPAGRDTQMFESRPGVRP